MTGKKTVCSSPSGSGQVLKDGSGATNIQPVFKFHQAQARCMEKSYHKKSVEECVEVL
jgi:hypothetical protein